MATFNAMDVWQTVCYLTVFFSVLEFCLVIYLTKKASWEDGLGVGKKKVDIVQNQKESHKVKIFGILKIISSANLNMIKS